MIYRDIINELIRWSEKSNRKPLILIIQNMKKSKYLIEYLIVISLFFMFSCGGVTENKSQDESFAITGHDVITEMVLEEEEEPDLSKGKEIFRSKCMVCHQESGLGIPGSIPPLAGSDYLLAVKKRAYIQVQNGSKVPITINGVEYPGGVMPPQELTQEETIEVLNYVYNSWGNDGGKVTLKDVQ